jgi:hypothetical protein
MIDTIQDEELAKADLRDHERLVAMRQPWEATYQEVDARFPNGAGGFSQTTPGQIRGARNYDATPVNKLERFAAAGVAITTPEQTDYIRPRFLDAELMKLRSVKLWCEEAGRRLYAIRHAISTGFGIAVNEDWDQLGRYGTSAMWQEAIEGRGLVYRCLHLSEVWIDVDVAGLVDTAHRKFCKTARQLEQMFEREALTPKMLDALNTPGKEHTEFEILHVVAPNREWDAERLDWRRFPIASRYLALDEKLYLRRKGFHTMPISVSRHMTSAGEIYGRSPAIKTMPNIQGLNAMKLDTLRAGKKAVDPALILNNDDGVAKVATKAGGVTAGLVDDMGRPKVLRMPGGENGIPYAIEMIQDEREQIGGAFLEEFYKILTDPNSRMTTTEVLEVMSKQGVLVRPYASRYATEKQHPMTQRDLDLALRARQIADFPPEVKEAGAWPMIDYENPLAAMARAENTAKTMRYIEYATAVSNLTQTAAADTVDIDEALRAGAEEIGVKTSILRDPEAVAKIRAKRDQQQQELVDAEQLNNTADATLKLAKAGQAQAA